MNLRWPGPAAVAILIAAATPVSAAENNPGTGFPAIPLTRSSAAPDTTLWAAIKGSSYRELFELFLDKYPNSPNARYANDALAAIDGKATSIDGAAASALLLARRNRSQVVAIFTNRIDGGSQADIARLQRDLVARGCNAGSPDGVWGSRSVRAAKRFVRATGVNVDGSVPSTALGKAVGATSGDICGDFARRSPTVFTGTVARRPIFRNTPTPTRARDRRRRR